ncbi:transposase family protein [Psychrosphaera algicola]|uniref:transposase family protein n=1 Tax=Psychrosphaera algicola TaxID=3023714 RepID=UPI00351CD395
MFPFTNNFITHFSVIEEPLLECCIKYELITILYLFVCVVLTGVEVWEIFKTSVVEMRLAKKYFPFKNSILKHNTITRVLSRLNAASIQIYFISWAKEIATGMSADIISIGLE